MLLRRVIDHVKTQNWTAVGLDFVIVVVGVFIGIQVANWNGVQQDKARAATLLSRLEADLRKMNNFTLNQRDWYYQRTVELDGFLTQLEAGNIPPEEETNRIVLNAISGRLPLNPPPSFDEMLSSGRLELIESDLVQNALHEFSVATDTSGRASSMLFEISAKAVSRINPYVIYARAPAPELERYYGTIEAVELDALRADRDARTALSQLFEFHTNMQLLTQQTSQAIEKTLAAIEAEKK